MDKKLGWIDFCKKFAKENNMKYTDALKHCSEAYKNYKGNQHDRNQSVQRQSVQPILPSKRRHISFQQGNVGSIGKKEPSEWIKFCKEYAGAKGCKYCDALKLGGADFKKYKEMKGAGLVDTINDFLSKFVAGPIGDAIKNAMVKRFKGV